MLTHRTPRSVKVRSATAGAAATGRLGVGTLAVGSSAVGALAVGALAVGSLAVGALAVGRLVLGAAEVRRLRIGRLELGELVLPQPGPALSVTVDAPFDEVVDRTRGALAAEGFGVLSEIDVAATLRAKLGVDLAPQVILGACNPPLAHRGLQMEPDLGLLLPCNVVLRVDGSGATRVSAQDPRAMVTATGRPELEAVAEDARARLQAVLEALSEGQETSASSVTKP